MLSSLILILAICMDAFAVSVTYGLKKIKIPLFSAIIISFTGTAFLAVSLFLAGFLKRIISKETCIALSVILLFAIGITDLFQNTIKAYLRRHKGQKNVSFSLFNISFAIDIFLDETKADKDNSKTLSAKEAVLLAVALSIDSLATGFGAGLGKSNIILELILCFIFGIFSVLMGRHIGEKIQCRTKIDLSWLSGALLIVLGIINLIS